MEALRTPINNINTDPLVQRVSYTNLNIEEA